MSAGSDPFAAPRDNLGPFIRRVLIVIGMVALVFLLWRAHYVLLLAFASVMVGVVLTAAARPLCRRLHLPRRWAVLIAGMLILIAVGLVAVLIGAQVREQVSELLNRLPATLEQLAQQVGQLTGSSAAGEGAGTQGEASAAGSGSAGVRTGGRQGGDAAGGLLQDALDAGDLSGWMGAIASYGFGLVAAITEFLLVIVGGFFLASSPQLYRAGLAKLFPKDEHARVEDALVVSGEALRLWLLAQLVAAVLVGTLIGLGTWAIGLPAPLALGLFAAAAEFVPIVGPIVGAIPALLLSLTQDGSAILWTAALFLAVQQLEANIITPIVQKRAVEIPPALILFSVVAFGYLFGIIGFIVAGPLTILLFVLVKKLYVRQTLGEETYVPGEDEAQEQYG